MSQGADNSGRVSALAEQMRAGAGVPGVAARALDAMASPSLGLGLLVALAFAALTSVATIITRSQPLVAVGRVMDETRLVRREIRAEDEAQTQQRREQARQATPRVYVADKPVLDKIRADLENLPRTVSAAESVEAVDSAIREQFGLTPEILAGLKAEAADGQSSSSWLARIKALSAAMTRRPLLDAQTWQRANLEGTSTVMRLVVDGRSAGTVLRGQAVNVEDAAGLANMAGDLARDAGLTGPLRQAVVNRLTVNARPTFTFDAAATAADQNEAAQAVEPVVVVSPVGQVIFQRGEVLTESQADLFDQEMAAFDAGMPGWVRWLRWGSVCAVCATVTLALSGYTLLFCPRVKRNASRITGVASILAGAMVMACVLTAWIPQLAAMTAVAPTVLVTMLITIGYDRRAALAYSLLHGLLVCVALREGIGTYGVIVSGVAAVVWSLKEIRDRNSLLRATLVTAMAVAMTTAAFSLVDRPVDRPISATVIKEIGLDSLWAGIGALVVGAATLFLLPLIERAFNVTTGMTLVELRDPKQPLLRELQQRAPGTYNHSLNVASIAEAAAEAIGADGLLTYVGSLYHDIGKMNKPEYFVENQLGGPNRHDKLSPAMSLLIVVGHVKDGMELAREFKLPARLQHFIEAHHGTTLVEYFYHRARRQALSTAPRDEAGNPIEEDTYVPDELEYRYPGPKPKTREVAILMIADAVESAARAMNEPSPTKIDQLVRGIAHKRLLDGQFEECEITLKDLNLIVESVIRTVTSMHHGRIAYPQGGEREAIAPPDATDTTASPKTQPGLPTRQ